MSPTKTIISKALHLKPDERFIIIETLIKSLGNPAWAIEAEKRLKAHKTGKLKTVPLENMFKNHFSQEA